MARPKHRKRNESLPKIAFVCLVLYVPCAVLTFAGLQASSRTFTAPPMEMAMPVLDDAPSASAEEVLQTYVHTQPDANDLTSQVTVPVIDTNPTTVKQKPTTTANTPASTTTQVTTTKSVPKTTTKNPAPTTIAKVNTAPAVVVTTPQSVPIQPPAQGSTFRERFYTSAKAYLGAGIPYVYGGKTTSGLDCSGFIWTVLRKLSPMQPYRASGSLKAWATSITQQQVLPGDLVFWPGHVAVYAGNNQVINQGGPGPGPILISLWPGYSFGRIPL